MTSPCTPLWVLLIGSLGRDRTSRSQSFEAEFPLEAWVTPVVPSIDSAVGLLLNLKAAQRGRSVLFSGEQNLLLKEKKKGSA
jgi:hypothetical protein